MASRPGEPPPPAAVRAPARELPPAVARLAADVERALLLRAGHHRAWQRCKYAPERAQDPIPTSEQQLCASTLRRSRPGRMERLLPARTRLGSKT
jgi:hypothetical protein